MCTGLEIAALAAAGMSVGGTVMQNNAMNASQKAAANATMAELARQKQLRAEAEKIFASSQQRSTASSMATDRNKATQQREAVYQSTVSKPEDTGYAPATASGTAPQIIQDEFKRAGTDAARAGTNQATARAALDGWGDAQTFMDIFNRRQGQKLSDVGGFSKWSQEALGPELDAARAKASSPWGDLLVGLGKAGMQAFGGPALGSMFGPSAAAAGGNIVSSMPTGGLNTSAMFNRIVPFDGGAGGLF